MKNTINILYNIILPKYIKVLCKTVKFYFFNRGKNILIGYYTLENLNLAKTKENLLLWNWVDLGNFNYLTWKISIWKYTYLNSPWVRLSSSEENPIKIGNYSSIAWGVNIISANFHNSIKLTTSDYLWKFRKYAGDSGWIVTIGNDVWIWCNSIILPWVTIWNWCIIWAWSVVTRSTPPYTILVWNPARVIKKRFDDNIILKIEESKWWEKEISDISQEEFNLTNFITWKK